MADDTTLPNNVEPAPPPKNKGGRPPFEPTNEQRQLVQILVANGVAEAIIAANVHWRKGDKGIDVKTLHRAFPDELAGGHAQTEAAMGAAVVRSGLGGNVGAQKYWLQTHGNDSWKITETLRHGMTPDMAELAGKQAIIAPVLIIQPVRAIDPAKTNGHNVTPDPACVPLDGDATDASA